MNRDRSGIALVEALLALLLFGVVALPLLDLAGSGTRTTRLAGRRVLETVKAHGIQSLAVTGTTTGAAVRDVGPGLTRVSVRIAAGPGRASRVLDQLHLRQTLSLESRPPW